MGTLRRPPRHIELALRYRIRPEPFAVSRPERTPIPQSSPLKTGNIVRGAFVRIVGALMLEQNDEWAVGRRYMSLESLAVISDVPRVSLPGVAA